MDIFNDNCHINPDTPKPDKSGVGTALDWVSSTAQDVWSTATNPAAMKQIGIGAWNYIKDPGGALKDVGIGIAARTVGAAPFAGYLLGREGAMLALKGPDAAADDTTRLLTAPLDGIREIAPAAQVLQNPNSTEAQRTAANTDLQNGTASTLSLAALGIGSASGDLGPTMLREAASSARNVAMEIGRTTLGGIPGLEPAYAISGQVPAREVAGIAKGSPSIPVTAVAGEGTSVLSQNMGGDGGKDSGDGRNEGEPSRDSDGIYRFHSGQFEGAEATSFSRNGSITTIENRDGLFHTPDSPVRMTWDASRESLTQEFDHPVVIDGRSVTRFTLEPSDTVKWGKRQLYKLDDPFIQDALSPKHQALNDMLHDIIKKEFGRSPNDPIPMENIRRVYENPNGVDFAGGAVRVSTERLHDVIGYASGTTDLEVREYAKPTMVDERHVVERLEIQTTRKEGKAQPEEVRRYINSQGMPFHFNEGNSTLDPTTIEYNPKGTYLEFAKPLTAKTPSGQATFTKLELYNNGSREYINLEGLGLSDNPTSVWLVGREAVEKWGSAHGEIPTEYGDLKVNRRETVYTDSSMKKVQQIMYRNEEPMNDTGLTSLTIRTDGTHVEEYFLPQKIDGVEGVSTRQIASDKNQIVYTREDGSEVTAYRNPDGSFRKVESKPPGDDDDQFWDWFRRLGRE